MADQLEATGKLIKAVRLENFTDPDWQGFLDRRLFARYPAARTVLRRPHVIVVELRNSGVFTEDDENFFAQARAQGFFRRWEPLAEVPPVPKYNRAVFEDIGARIGEGERLTPTQQGALLSHLHDLEERALMAESEAGVQRTRAESAEARLIELSATYNEIVEHLGEELRITVYSDGDYWIAEDAGTGKILLRDVVLPVIYRKALRLRLETTQEGGTQ